MEEENRGGLGFIEGEVEEEFGDGSGGGSSCTRQWRSSGGRMGVWRGKDASGDGERMPTERIKGSSRKKSIRAPEHQLSISME